MKAALQTSVSCLGATPTVVVADAEAAEYRLPATHSGLSEMESIVVRMNVIDQTFWPFRERTQNM